MKKIWLGLVLSMALGAGSLWAAGSFEGEVDMKMTHENSDKTMMTQYFVKDRKMRVQTESEDGKFTGAAIMDMNTHQYIVVMDKQKMYMVSQVHPEKFQSAKKNNNSKFFKTGNSENILGYNCEEWDWKSDNDSGKIWFAKGFGNWWGSSMAANYDKLPPSQKAIVKMVVAQKMFPLKYETTNKAGDQTGTMEVVKVDKKSLSSSLFEPPAGYKKVQMPNFGGDGSGKKPTKEDLMKMMEQFKK